MNGVTDMEYVHGDLDSLRKRIERLESGLVTEALGAVTLLDWFAGQALAGLVASDRIVGREGYDLFAIFAYKLADAMIAERVRRAERADAPEKTPTPGL